MQMHSTFAQKHHNASFHIFLIFFNQIWLEYKWENSCIDSFIYVCGLYEFAVLIHLWTCKRSFILHYAVWTCACPNFVLSWKIHLMISILVHSKCVSWPGYFSTQVTWMRDASDMICFNVARHVSWRCFLSTNVAGSNVSFAISRFDISFCHHCIDLLF